MYAILQHGGHQYRVTAGDRLLVDRLPADVGSVVALEPVVLFSDGDRLETGSDAVAGMRVAATVVAHRRGRKLRVFKYKAKKRNRRTLGFRADLTELVVGGVLLQGEALPEPETAADHETPVVKRRGRAAGAIAPAVDEVAAEAAVDEATLEAGVALEAKPSARAPKPAVGTESGTETPVADDEPASGGDPGAEADAAAPQAAPRKPARRRARAATESAGVAAGSAEATAQPAEASTADSVDTPSGTGADAAPAKRRRVARKAPATDAGDTKNEA